MNYLTPAEVAARLKISRATVSRLVDEENLPMEPLRVGPKGNRLLRIDADVLDRWVAGRRERQIQGVLNGTRFVRRAE